MSSDVVVEANKQIVEEDKEAWKEKASIETVIVEIVKAENIVI